MNDLEVALLSIERWEVEAAQLEQALKRDHARNVKWGKAIHVGAATRARTEKKIAELRLKAKREKEWVARISRTEAAGTADLYARLPHDVATEAVEEAAGDAVQKSASEVRAALVEKVLSELSQLKTEAANAGGMTYETMKARHPDFLVFAIADKHSDHKQRIEALPENRRVVWIAQKLVASHSGTADATVKTDWADHKPFHRRAKKAVSRRKPGGTKVHPSLPKRKP